MTSRAAAAMNFLGSYSRRDWVVFLVLRHLRYIRGQWAKSWFAAAEPGKRGAGTRLWTGVLSLLRMLVRHAVAALIVLW
jgi:hypothetical protein